MYLQLRTNKNPQNDDACSINQFATVTWYQLVPMWSKPWPHIATNSLPMSHAQLGGDSQTKTLRKLSDRMTCTYGSHCRTLRRWIAEVCSMRPVEMSILWRSSCVNILSFQLNKNVNWEGQYMLYHLRRGLYTRLLIQSHFARHLVMLAVKTLKQSVHDTKIQITYIPGPLWGWSL